MYEFYPCFYTHLTITFPHAVSSALFIRISSGFHAVEKFLSPPGLYVDEDSKFISNYISFID